jgi:uncharacterized protein YhaN
MSTFLSWLESLNRIEGVLLYCFVCTVLCTIIHCVDRWFATAELRAIKWRVWAQKKARFAELLEAQRQREQREADDAQFLRRLNIDIANDDAQNNRERQQFHLPAAFRDFKGVTKQ